MRACLLIWLTLASVLVLVAQANKTESVLLDPNRPSVYMTFVKSGKCSPFREGESKERVWLALTNNTRWTISIGTFGAPEDCGKNDYGVEYEVVRYGPGWPDGPLPAGYLFEVSSIADLKPGAKVVFSVARNHLDLGLGISVNFTFDWELNQGATRHSSLFSYWDLPDSLRDKKRERSLPPHGGKPTLSVPAPPEF
jgi:hypothetical protein